MSARQSAVLLQRPIRIALFVGLGLSAWSCAFIPFVIKSDLLKAMLACCVYSFALAGIVTGIILQVGSRLYWAWIVCLASFWVAMIVATAIIGGSPELWPEGASHWMLVAVYHCLSFSVIVAAAGWVVYWTRARRR